MSGPAASPRGWRDRLLRPTLPELWLFLAIALPVLAALIATLPTVDLAYQLRAGAGMLDGQGIPSVDTWTFTAAGRPWVDQQWLAQQFLALVYRAGGWTALALLRAVLVGAIQGFLLGAILRTAPGLRPRTAALLALGAFIVMAPALALRPQLFGMALFAGALAVLAGRRERPGWWWIVPVLAVVWANYHGSFILAPLLVGLAWLEDLRDGSPAARRTLGTLAATTIATFATPFGFGAWQYAVSLARNQALKDRISEWQAPRLTDVPGALFWLSVLSVTVVVVVVARRRHAIPWPAVLTLVAFAGLAAIAVRGIAWWSGVAAVTLAGLLGQGIPGAGASVDAGAGASAGAGVGAAEPPRRAPRGSVLNALVAAVLILAGIALLPIWRPIDPGTGAPRGLLAEAPSGITAALRRLATANDRVWNPQVWGSWFEFAVPAPTYALDSRIEIFSTDFLDYADQVPRAGPAWQLMLEGEQDHVSIVVVDGGPQGRLARALAVDTEVWRQAYADADGSVWVRVDR